MAITIPELNQRLDKMVDDITNGMGNTMVQIGNDALFSIRERVIKTGIDAEGNKFEPYSTKPMLANCSSMKTDACTRIASSKEKRKELKWITLKRHSKVTGKDYIRLFQLPQGYKQYRELHSLQTGFVDFLFSGRMWNNIKITSNEGEHSKGLVRIGATTDEDKKVLEGNTKRRGDILKLSEKELNELRESYGRGIQQIINRDLG